MYLYKCTQLFNNVVFVIQMLGVADVGNKIAASLGDCSNML